MKNKIYISLVIITFTIISCNSKAKKEENKTIFLKTESISHNTLNEIWKTLPLKKSPIIDSTNFDNIIKLKEFNKEEIKLLKLKKVYPEIEKENSPFKIYPSYKLELSDQYYTLIINIYKGEHELETLLVNYSKDEKIINYKVISYDEIAEGWSRKHSKINSNVITVIDEFYGNNKQNDTTKFHINRNGEINQIKTKFSSKLRPNKNIILNKVYTDTIEFKKYNYDGDYPYLKGKKKGVDVYLNNHMDWYDNDKYKFNYDDIIKVQWKMDTIWIAGDGETLDFAERVIDAEKIEESDNTKYILALKNHIIQESSKQNDLETKKYNFESNILTIQGNDGFNLSSYDFNDIKIYKTEKSKNIKIEVYNIGGGGGGNVIVSETYILTNIDSMNFHIENGKTELMK